MSGLTVTTEQVRELIQQLAAMTAAASITPEIVANIFENMRQLNDQEREKVIAVAEAYIAEIRNTGVDAEHVTYQENVNIKEEIIKDKEILGILDINGVGFIGGNNKWQNSATYNMAIIPVNAGDVITISDTSNRFIAYLTSNNHTIGEDADYVSGTGRTTNNVQNLTIPEGCKYFAFAILSNGTDVTPTSIIINDIERLVNYNVPKALNTKINSISLCPTSNSLPNIDSTNETISFGSDCFLLIDGNRYKLSTTAVSLRVSGSSLSKIVFNLNTGTLTAKAYTARLSGNEVLVGGVRFDSHGIQANFPFIYTMDGKPFYLKETDYIHIKDANSVEGVAFSQSDETRVKVNYPACAGLLVNIGISNSYKFSVQCRKGTTLISDSGWKTSYNSKINVDCDNVILNFAAANGNDTITVADIKAAISTFEIEVFDITKVPNYDLIGRIFSDINTNVVSIQGLQSSLAGKSEVGVIEVGTDDDFSEVENELYTTNNRVKMHHKIAITEGQEIKLELASGTTYYFALRIHNADNAQLYDSGWKQSLSKTTPVGAASFEFLFKRSDDANMSDSDITAIIADVEDFSYTYERPVLTGNAPKYEEYKAAIDALKSQSSMPKSIRSIAHQGYNTVQGESIGNCRVSSYVGAAKAGFDYGECDIQFTSDEVAVCCHDASFTDLDSQNTIVIAEHTLAELKTYNYHHEQIASFEEIVAACKENGIGLYIDHLNEATTDARWQHLFNIVKKYAMEDRVAWLAGTPSKIFGFYDRSEMIWTLATLPSDRVSWINEWRSTYPNGIIKVNLNYSQNSVEDIITLNSLLATGVYVEIWTCDDATQYRNYLPYVSGITSNSISEKMIKQN